MLKRFKQSRRSTDVPGRTPEEKIADAATVHRFTGVAPAVALHIPWDRVDDYAALTKYARDLGVEIGAINTNVFQDEDYKLGSVTNPDPRIRRKATDHLVDAVSIMEVLVHLGSQVVDVRRGPRPHAEAVAMKAAAWTLARSGRLRIAERVSAVFSRLGGRRLPGGARCAGRGLGTGPAARPDVDQRPERDQRHRARPGGRRARTEKPAGGRRRRVIPQDAVDSRAITAVAASTPSPDSG
jgi:hypothetical protein